MRPFALVEAAQRGTWTWYADSRTSFFAVLFSVSIVYERATKFAVDLSVWTLNLPVIFKFSLRHLLVAALAVDGVMQTPLIVVLSLYRLAAFRVFTLDHGIAAINVNMVLHLSTLDLRLAAVFALRAFHDQVVQNIHENFCR